MDETTEERASTLAHALWWLYDYAPPFVHNWMPEHQERAMANEQYEQHLNRHGLQEMADGLGLAGHEDVPLPSNPHEIWEIGSEVQKLENGFEIAVITGQSKEGYHARWVYNDGSGLDVAGALWSQPFETRKEAELYGSNQAAKLWEIQQAAADMRSRALVAYEQATTPAERSELRSQAAELTVLMDAVQDAIAGSDRVSLGQVNTAAIEPLIERIEAVGITVEVEAPSIAQEGNEHQQEVER